MEDIVSTAESFIENFRKTEEFDYSVKSLEPVDKLIEELGETLDVLEPHERESALYNMTTVIGCYVFETARRNYGGEYYWLREEEQPVLVAGLPDFRVTIKAWEKVRGRILNGKEDNIPFYIDGFREHIEKGKATENYNVTIV